jgi:TPR repeat protein
MKKVNLENDKTWDLGGELANEFRQLIHCHIIDRRVGDDDDIWHAALLGHIDALVIYINLLQFDKDQALTLFNFLLRSDGPRHQEWTIFGLEARAKNSFDTTDQQEACFKLGHIYKFGIGVDENLDKAFSYFLQGANLEHADSMFEITYFLSELDVEKKLTMLEKAAVKGSAAAHYNLGVLLGEIESSRQNYTQQIHHYKLAAAREFVPAYYNLGWMYQNGDPQIIDFQQAIFWYELAANKNHLEAINNLGEIYLLGQGVPVNKIEALKWFLLGINDKFDDPEVRIAEILPSISASDALKAVTNAENWVSDRPYLGKKLLLDKIKLDTSGRVVLNRPK